MCYNINNTGGIVGKKNKNEKTSFDEINKEMEKLFCELDSIFYNFGKNNPEISEKCFFDFLVCVCLGYIEKTIAQCVVDEKLQTREKAILVKHYMERLIEFYEHAGNDFVSTIVKELKIQGKTIIPGTDTLN